MDGLTYLAKIVGVKKKATGGLFGHKAQGWKATLAEVYHKTRDGRPSRLERSTTIEKRRKLVSSYSGLLHGCALEETPLKRDNAEEMKLCRE